MTPADATVPCLDVTQGSFKKPKPTASETTQSQNPPHGPHRITPRGVALDNRRCHNAMPQGGHGSLHSAAPLASTYEISENSKRNALRHLQLAPTALRIWWHKAPKVWHEGPKGSGGTKGPKLARRALSLLESGAKRYFPGMPQGTVTSHNYQTIEWRRDYGWHKGPKGSANLVLHTWASERHAGRFTVGRTYYPRLHKVLVGTQGPEDRHKGPKGSAH